jgi:hypothetical protein
MEIKEFLELDESDFSRFSDAYDYTIELLDRFNKSDFKFDMCSQVDNVVSKLLQFGSENKDLSEDISSIKKKLQSLIEKAWEYHRGTLSTKQLDFYFHHLITPVTSFYTKMNKTIRSQVKDEHLDFNGMFIYDNSNKRLVIDLLTDVIDLIDTDPIISTKSKNKLKKHLNDCITELVNPKSNWSFFFSRIAETTIILGSLGSIAGGIAATSNLFEAQEKVEEAAKTVVNTSVNINYNNVQDIFNIDENIRIENNKVIMLSDTTHNKH